MFLYQEIISKLVLRQNYTFVIFSPLHLEFFFNIDLNIRYKNQIKNKSFFSIAGFALKLYFSTNLFERLTSCYSIMGEVQHLQMI